ncbi:MAG: RraA family protein [Vulcanimicrobiaceae bacterium]|jgi:4-hydroxy-4-methyl-2-oxoglutarate aldolase
MDGPIVDAAHLEAPKANLEQRLGRLDCCAVSDALDRLGQPAAVTGLRQFASSRRICGRVVTFKLADRRTTAEPDGPRVHLGVRALETAGPGSVVVIEQRTGIDAASWGGILSLAAKLYQIEGVIAEGAVRDIEEARALDLPVFSRGLTARTARGRLVEAGTNVPVRIGDVEVAPGDYVVADNSGVAFIAADQAERVIAFAESLAGREGSMAKSLLGGKPLHAVMGTSYETMLEEQS